MSINRTELIISRHSPVARPVSFRKHRLKSLETMERRRDDETLAKISLYL
jgi:hypothetical protein